MGSPPRGREKVSGRLTGANYARITPAWAGKRTRSWRAYGCPWDHPRVGGEKIIWASVSIAALESPPHGRGKGVVEGGHVEVNRITPAWAGKSLVTPSIPQTRGDHPRVGGEKTVTEKGETQRTGSPPRRRGKDRRLVVDVLPEGITPAWAGKSLASQPWSPPLWMMVIRPRP